MVVKNVNNLLSSMQPIHCTNRGKKKKKVRFATANNFSPQFMPFVCLLTDQIEEHQHYKSKE